MSGREFERGAAVLPMQVQWQHQVRSSKLFDGMAITFAEEALRAVQNPVSIHKTLSPKYAKLCPSTDFLASSCSAYLENPSDLVQISFGAFRLGGLASLVYADCLEGSFLDCRRWMDQLAEVTRASVVNDAGTDRHSLR